MGAGLKTSFPQGAAGWEWGRRRGWLVPLCSCGVGISCALGTPRLLCLLLSHILRCEVDRLLSSVLPTASCPSDLGPLWSSSHCFEVRVRLIGDWVTGPLAWKSLSFFFTLFPSRPSASSVLPQPPEHACLPLGWLGPGPS